MKSKKKTIRPAQTRGLALRERILDACRELLADYQPEKITSAMVLARSNVSRNTLYHHFGDMPSLIRAALVADFSENFSSDVDVLKEILKNSATQSQFRMALQQVTVGSQGEGRRRSRYNRTRVITYCAQDPAIARELADTQRQLTTKLAEFVERAQDRGWVRRDIDSRIISVFLQSYTLGKIVDDLVPDPVPASGWNTMIDKIVMSGLLEPEDSSTKKYGTKRTK